ncbi:biotin/lipoyl-binding protein, partial [Paenarthrobacter sp. CM16]|nr:biotin/lipoyl-binding protein [Paenarthrobacter sp. CM16]
ETVIQAPVDGVVHRVLPSAGAQVVAGEALVVLEPAEVREPALVLEGSSS